MPTALRPAALVALRAFAVDPAGLGGVRLRGPCGPERDAWLAALRELLPAHAPWRQVPCAIDAERLSGGLDLPATLRAGRPVHHAGLVAEAAGGLLVISMAERCGPGIAALLAAALDGPDGHPADGPGIVALDEALPDDPEIPAVLAERLGIDLRLAEAADAPTEPGTIGSMPDRARIAAARARLPGVRADDEIVAGLCQLASVLGIRSLRAPVFALRVAAALAALDGRALVDASDAAWGARLVLGPRALRLPPEPDAAADDQARDPDHEAQAPDAEDAADPATDRQPPATADARSALPGTDDAREAPPAPAATDGPDVPNDPSPTDTDPRLAEEALAARLVAAAATTLPSALLQAAATGGSPGRTAAGRSNVTQRAATHGRPVGTVSRAPRGGGRLDLVQTLRVAAPWQALRRRESPSSSPGRVQVRGNDFRWSRFRQRMQGTTIFAVDASGSQALHRLSEAKGAVELLLGQCYVRRDRVALLAFRDRGATLLLPPTRSLVRAKRCLSELPGGGGTPLATAIDASADLAQAVTRGGGACVLVLLTDGCANVARDGTPGRPMARRDAMASAAAWRATGVASLLIDTGTQPQPVARQLALAMAARYVPLPDADAPTLARAIAQHPPSADRPTRHDRP